MSVCTAVHKTQKQERFVLKNCIIFSLIYVFKVFKLSYCLETKWSRSGYKENELHCLIKKESKQPRTCSQTPSPSFTQGLGLQNYSEDTIEYCESQAQLLCVYGATIVHFIASLCFGILCYPLLPLGWNCLVWCEEWKMFSLDDVRRPSEVF